MNINISLYDFKKRHINKKNQVIFHIADCQSNKIIKNLMHNFLVKKNIKLKKINQYFIKRTAKIIKLLKT